MMKLKRYLKNSAKSLLLAVSLLIICIYGCSDKTPEEKITGPVEQKLINTFKKDYNMDITAKLVNKTLWMYIPIEQDILILDRAKTLFDEEKIQKFNVRYISGDYESKIFEFSFYIDQNPELPKMKEVFEGVTYDLTEKAAGININAYHYLEELSWSSPDQISFFVLVIADIKRGIEYTQTINALDLKKLSMNALPSDEFSKRTLSHIKGDEKIIDDKGGSHLTYSDIKIIDFIIQQTINRTRMELPTKHTLISAADVNKIILETLWNAITNYAFDDFFMVKISNMVSGDIISYSKTAMEERFSKTIRAESIQDSEIIFE